MRRVVPFELVEHVADGDMFPFFIAGAPEGVFDPDASGLQRPDFCSPGVPVAPCGQERQGQKCGFDRFHQCGFMLFPNFSGMVRALWTNINKISSYWYELVCFF